MPRQAGHRQRPLAAGQRAGGPPEILVTRQFSEAYDAGIGDVVSLAAHSDGSGAREFRIVGIYEPTPDPMRLTARRRIDRRLNQYATTRRA